MADVLVRVCDVDLRQGTVRRYTVTVEGDTSTYDLCDEHAGLFAPLSAPKEQTPPEPPVTQKKPARKRAASKSSRRNVTTLEEIEKGKAT